MAEKYSVLTLTETTHSLSVLTEMVESLFWAMWSF